MIDEDAYCIAVLTQVSAATKALQAPPSGSSTTGRATAVGTAMAEGDAAALTFVAEATKAIERSVKA